jgi:hypothetical protein
METIINSVVDVVTGQVNNKLSSGGPITVSGSKIKIAGDNPANGVSLTNQGTGEVMTVPANTIAVNEPSKVIFVAPHSLEPGDYKLSITTQFSSAAQALKEPRSYTFDYLLNVL